MFVMATANEVACLFLPWGRVIALSKVAPVDSHSATCAVLGVGSPQSRHDNDLQPPGIFVVERSEV